jgi:hypothetical protein
VLPGPEPASKANRLEVERAAGLVEALEQAVRGSGGVGLSATPMTWPGDGTLVAWLRRLLHQGIYTRTLEETLAWRWLGTDPFGLRHLPGPPPFLAGTDVTGVPAAHVGAFLRRISMTRPVPRDEELAPEALARDRRPVTVVRRSREQRRWGQHPASGAPLLPEWTRLPHVVHGIWLGRALPPQSAFWRNFAEASFRWAGQVDFVLWTDIPRTWFAQAAQRPAPPRGSPDPLGPARTLLSWATASGVSLVNVHEIFSAAAPMLLHGPYVLEMSKQRPGGYAAASDHLRVEIVHRFGGMYADGDISFHPAKQPMRLPPGMPDTRPRELPALLRDVAASTHAFTVNPFFGMFAANDIVIAPAGHPLLALWRECARTRYFVGQVELFGGLKAMAEHVGRARLNRYVTPQRTGRVHHLAMRMAGVRPDHLVQTQAAISHDSELSWVPPAGGDRPDAPAVTHSQVVEILAKALTFLRWQLTARDGNLYLSAVAPVIQGLPDPDAAWIALLTMLTRLGPGVPPVTSVTDQRADDHGALERVVLPAEAEALIDRTVAPAHWLGAQVATHGAPVWLLDELVSPAVLRTGA